MTFIDQIVPIFLGFREGLEAVLVVVIILLYLKNSKQQFYKKYVYLGAYLAILSSIVFAYYFNALLGGFSGIPEELFEGYTFIISGILIVTLILWMSKEGPKMKQYIEEKVENSIQTQKLLSITLLSFIIIIREGVELVFMLTGTTSIGSLNSSDVIIGSVIGLGIAVIIGILTYYGVKTINLSKFFKITNVVLILFAAGLITYGIHELIEAGVVNPIIEEVWNIKHILPEKFLDGNPATSEWLEILGSLLKAMFGYNANPSLLEVIIYPSLLTSIGFISYKLWKKTSLMIYRAKTIQPDPISKTNKV
ncbi:MAG: FTR1 family iron permease [Promethearchaeota archaeon]|jgi:high-affinity iron transporter